MLSAASVWGGITAIIAALIKTIIMNLINCTTSAQP
jgi:hypothetical protein